MSEAIHNIAKLVNVLHRPIFDYHLMKMKEAGILQKIEKVWRDTIDGKADAKVDPSNVVYSLRFEDLFAPFVIVLGGVGASVAVSLSEFAKHAIELLWRRLCSRK